MRRTPRSTRTDTLFPYPTPCRSGESPQRPVVLLSGGVGLTPMVSMLEALVEHGSEVPVQYIHGTHDRDTHAMRDHVRALAAKGHAVRVIDFHQTPLADEVAGRDYDHAGLKIGRASVRERVGQ